MRQARCTTRRIAAPSRVRARTTALLAVVLLVVLAAGCASKRYVRHEVERVNDHLTASVVDRELDATAGTLTSHEARLAEAANLAALALERAREATQHLREASPLDVSYSVDGIRFPPGSARLTAEAESLLDQLATRLKLENRATHLEIRAPAGALGNARGETVRRHLHITGGVPLHVMRVLLLADALPAAPDAASAGPTGDGHVAIVVLRPRSLP